MALICPIYNMLCPCQGKNCLDKWGQDLSFLMQLNGDASMSRKTIV